MAPKQAVPIQFVCSIGADTKVNIAKIRCERCAATTRGWVAFIRHHVQQHSVPMQALRGHFAFQRALHEHMTRAGASMTQDEYDHLEPGEDEGQFMCKGCAQDRGWNTR